MHPSPTKDEDVHINISTPSVSTKMLDSGLMASAKECIGEVDELFHELMNAGTSSIGGAVRNMNQSSQGFPYSSSLYDDRSLHSFQHDINDSSNDISTRTNEATQEYGSSIIEDNIAFEVNRTLFDEDEQQPNHPPFGEKLVSGQNENTDENDSKFLEATTTTQPVFIYSGAIGRVNNIIFSSPYSDAQHRSSTVSEFDQLPQSPFLSSSQVPPVPISFSECQQYNTSKSKKFNYFLAQKTSQNVSTSRQEVSSKNNEDGMINLNSIGNGIVNHDGRSNISEKMMFLERKVVQLENELSKLKAVSTATSDQLFISNNNRDACDMSPSSLNTTKLKPTPLTIQKNTIRKHQYIPQRFQQGEGEIVYDDDTDCHSPSSPVPTFVSHFNGLSCPQLDDFDINYNHVFVNPALSPKSMRKLTLKHRYNKILQDKQTFIQKHNHSQLHGKQHKHHTRRRDAGGGGSGLNNRDADELSPFKLSSSNPNHEHLQSTPPRSNHKRRSMSPFLNTSQQQQQQQYHHQQQYRGGHQHEEGNLTDRGSLPNPPSYALMKGFGGREEKFNGIPWRP